MAASAGSQHRCVFVGNIPYDATEEQLIQICEEVGPVVSFRLVTDRETGKPKGYGFCEYKDEETALSARRNLQGYEINGRQLRVDFAENDKNTDRNREQGRGGPGLTSGIDAQKHLTGPIPRDSALYQPIGLPSAANAASLMAGALGGAQTAAIQNGLRNLSGIGNDPLSHYLARMSKHHLTEIMAEIKALAKQNKALAHQLLQEIPLLPKALFQAEIMLGLVTPQMMQMANSLQSSSSVPQPSSHLGQAPSQKDAVVGMLSGPPEALVPNISQNAIHVSQSGPLLQHVPIQPPYQHPQQMQAPLPQGTMLVKSGVVTPSVQPQSVGGPIQSTPPLPISKGLIPQIQPPNLQQHPRPVGNANLAHNSLMALPNTSLQQSILPHPVVFQSGPSGYAPPLSGVETLAKGAGHETAGILASVSIDSTWPSRISTENLGAGLVEKTGRTNDISDLLSHPSKLRRLEDGSGVPQVINSSPAINPVSTQTIGTGSVSRNQTVHVDVAQHSERQIPQLTPEVETVLLQQVLSLTPEQLSALPLEQQQQVLQLQQMLSVSK